MKRICLKVRGLEFVSDLYTKKALKCLIPLAEKIVVDITDENITTLHRVYDGMEEIPDDRHKLVAWLNTNHPKEFTNLDEIENLNVLLSEILNVCEQTEGCTPVKIKVFMEDSQDVIELRIFTKVQPNESLQTADSGVFNYYTFENSEVIVVNEITKSFISNKIFNDTLINSLILRDTLTRNLVFENVSSANEYFQNEEESFLNSLEGQILYRLYDSSHNIDFGKEINSNNNILQILRTNDYVRLPKEIKQRILTRVLEIIPVDPIDANSPNYLAKNKIESMVSARYSISWTFRTNSNIEITATIDRGRISFDKEVCPTCGRIHEEELFTLPNGRKCCISCLRRNVESEGRVLGYHTNTITNLQRSCGNSPSEKARYGIELEMIRNSGDSTWNDKWYELIAPILYSEGNLGKLERDGSLGSNGEEMISQPLNKDFILGEKMKSWINNCKELYHPTSSCGLHVHVDRNALTPKQWGGVIRFISNNYNQFVTAGIFRPTNDYNRLDTLKLLSREESDDESLYDKFIASSQHYHSLSYSRHTQQTIEFRCFDSTVDYEKFIKNLKTIMVILDNAEALSNQSNIQIQI